MDPWTLHQLADSSLPTGGFAHSAGLEAAVQLGRVRGGDDLHAFVEEVLWATGAFALPFVRAARAEPAAVGRLAARCDAAIPGHVQKRASVSQGQAFLRAVSALAPELDRLAEELRRQGTLAHLPPVFGAVLGILGASEDDTARLYLFATARGILSAAVRLGLVGPLEAQSLLARCGPLAAAVRDRCRSRDPVDAAATAPLVDLLQAHQDRLYSRLFQS